jgi:peptide/nickel transport system substrate-binding protein
MKSTLIMKCLTLFIAMAFILGACTPAAPAATQPAAVEPTKAAVEPTKAAAEPTKAPEATKAPEPTKAAAPADYLTAAREDTLILDAPNKFTTTDNWNPYVPSNNYGYGMSELGMTYAGYLNYGDGKNVMMEAESAEGNADGSVWTWKVRKGVTWSDGVAFNADDIIYSIDLQMKNEKLGSHFYLLEWVDKMEKLDDFTVKFTLKKPNQRFAQEAIFGFISGPNITLVPKHIWEAVQDPTTFKNFDIAKGLPLGTGPYILAKVTENDTIWVRNDNWWAAKTGFKKLPEPKKIIFSYVGTEEVRTQTAIDNGFDSMQDITLGAYQAILAQNDKWVAFFPDKPYSWLDPCARIISLNSAKAPWDDKQMRQMLNFVMDRQQIVDIAYEGTTILAPYFWPAYPSMKPYADLIPTATMDKFMKPSSDEAAKILTAKGYTKGAKYWAKDGKDLTIEIQVPQDFIELTRVGDVYVEQLQKFGINATEAKLGAAFYDNFNSGNYEAQSNWFACGSISEPYKTLNVFTGVAAPMGTTPKGGPIDNGFRWSNKEYSDLVAQIGVTKLDDPKLLDLTKKALAILYDELPALPAAQARKLVPFNTKYWTGWPTNANYYMQPTNWWTNFVVILTTISKAK